MTRSLLLGRIFLKHQWLINLNVYMEPGYRLRDPEARDWGLTIHLINRWL